MPLATKLTWVDFVAQQGTQVSFVANGIQFPTSQQASQYNALIGPLAAHFFAFCPLSSPFAAAHVSQTGH
jgi:hypothetical protein